MTLVLPVVDHYATWQEYARALNAALSNSEQEDVATVGTLTNDMHNLDPEWLPQPPEGYHRLWLSDTEAKLFLENPLYDPPTAPDIVFIDTQAIADAAIETAKLAESAVTTSKLLDGVVTELKVANDAISTAKIQLSAVTTAKIANLAVANAKLADLVVDAAKLADLAASSAKIQDNAIINAKLADLAVGTAELAAQAVAEAKLANGAVTTTKIGDAAITTAKIGLLAVASGQIQDAAIVQAKIGLLAVGAAQIIDAAVGTAKIADAAIVEAKIGLAAVTTAKIQDAAIINAKIADATILGAKLVDATIVGAKIANATIVTALIGDAQIVEAKIADLAVNTAKIANAAVSSAKIANLSVGAAHIIHGSIQTVHIGDAQISTAKIQDAAIDSAKIANTIQSSNWDAGTKTGWQIDKAGTLRGRGIEIYDTAGNLLFGSGSTLRTLGFRGDLDATTSVYINKNPKFADWPDGQERPEGWSTFNPGGGTFTRVAGLGTQYAMELQSVAGMNFFVTQQFGSTTLQTVTEGQMLQIFASARLNSGGLFGVGVRVEFYDSSFNVVGISADTSINFSADRSLAGTIPGFGIVGTEYQFSKTVKAPTGAFFFALSIDHANVLHGSIAAARNLTWREVGIRNVSDMDYRTFFQEDLATEGATIGTNLFGQMTAGNISTFIAGAAIGSALIANAAIGSALIADAAVIEAKIGAAAVATAKIGDLQVTTAKLIDAAVTTAKIADANITTAKIGDAQISTAKIANLAVDTLRLANQAVTIPVSAYTAAYVSIGGAVNTWTAVQSIVITSTGAPIHLFFQVYCGPADAGPIGVAADFPQYRLTRNGTVVFGPINMLMSLDRTSGMNVAEHVEQPGAGTFTYTLEVVRKDSDPMQVAHRSILALEVKK